MTIPTGSGKFDGGTNSYLPDNAGTWADLSGRTWANWTTWIDDPAQEIVYPLVPISLDRNTPFNLNIETDAQGEVSYKIYTSTSGAFSGEETETVISPTDTDIAAFSGQYVLVVVIVDSGGQLAQLRSVRVKTTTDNTFTISRSNVDTSTLGGSTSAREIPLSRTVSYIWSITITPHPESYTQDVYVTDYKAATTLIPTVVSKSRTTPTFKLVGLDNVPRDGTVDYELVVMGQQSMVGSNLVTI